MPMRGGRRQLRRESRRQGTGRPTRYRMREKIISIGDDFVIETAEGQRAFRIDGKALRIRNTIVVRTLDGRELYRVQERKIRLKDTYVIQRGRETVARLQKALVTPLRDRFSVEIPGGPPLHVQGNVLDHEYTITRQGKPVAAVSKRWFRIRDTYGVEVLPDEDHAFVLALVAAIDTV